LALVRHVNGMFITGVNHTVPFFTIILAKLMGLSRSPLQAAPTKPPILAFPGPPKIQRHGLEEAVKLGCRDNLAAIEGPEERLAKHEQMVAKSYDISKAVNQASYFNFDDTMDPADSQR
jgi:acetyl-CoA carboxylase carboxyltransferase component